MNRRFLFVLFAAALILAVALPTVPAYAQTTTTVTITEDEINAEALSRAKARSSLVEDLRIDLKPGQITIDYKGKTNRGMSVTMSGTFDVALTNGKITWKLVSATLNGTALNAATLRLVDSTIRGPVQTEINRVLKSEVKGKYTLKSLEITDTEMIITATQP